MPVCIYSLVRDFMYFLLQNALIYNVGNSWNARRIKIKTKIAKSQELSNKHVCNAREENTLMLKRQTTAQDVEPPFFSNKSTHLWAPDPYPKFVSSLVSNLLTYLNWSLAPRCIKQRGVRSYCCMMQWGFKPLHCMLQQGVNSIMQCGFESMIFEEIPPPLHYAVDIKSLFCIMHLQELTVCCMMQQGVQPYPLIKPLGFK